MLKSKSSSENHKILSAGVVKPHGQEDSAVDTVLHNSMCVCVCRISNLLLQYIIILPITLHLATFGGSLILEAQFPKHVITVVDTKLLLLNQS